LTKSSIDVLERNISSSVRADLTNVPARSGLYIVWVDCDDAPIDNDPRRKDPLRISRINCKFGRAKNLRARYRNYLDVFDKHSVTFKVIAILEDINAAETICVRRLAEFRMRGRSGRRHEWLANVSPSQVEEIVREALVAGGFVPAFEPSAIRRVGEDAIAEKLVSDHLSGSAALIALMLKRLPDKTRSRTFAAVRTPWLRWRPPNWAPTHSRA